jgi:hypothetical protein
MSVCYVKNATHSVSIMNIHAHAIITTAKNNVPTAVKETISPPIAYSKIHRPIRVIIRDHQTQKTS